jgi:hypothetical protein
MPITRVLNFELMGFLYGLAAIVLYQMLTGQINVTGLISRKDGSNQTSPERIQLLLATLAASATYLGEVAKNTSATMPDIGHSWIYVMGGSSTIYALRKAWSTWNASSN